MAVSLPVTGLRYAVCDNVMPGNLTIFSGVLFHVM